MFAQKTNLKRNHLSKAEVQSDRKSILLQIIIESKWSPTFFVINLKRIFFKIIFKEVWAIKNIDNFEINFLEIFHHRLHCKKYEKAHQNIVMFLYKSKFTRNFVFVFHWWHFGSVSSACYWSMINSLY